MIPEDPAPEQAKQVVLDALSHYQPEKGRWEIKLKRAKEWREIHVEGVRDLWCRSNGRTLCYMWDTPEQAQKNGYRKVPVVEYWFNYGYDDRCRSTSITLEYWHWLAARKRVRRLFPAPPPSTRRRTNYCISPHKAHPKV